MMARRDMSLRPYQADGIENARVGAADGHRSQILYAPCGAGKTEMAIALMKSCADRGRRVAMVLDRIVLVNQTSARLDSYGIEHGVLQAGHWRYRPSERIQICSAQTLEKRGSFPGLDLLIIDEAHQTRKQTKEFIKSNPQVRVLGLTGSPFTKGLGQTFTNIVNVTNTDSLIKLGNLVPLRVFVAKEIDMTGAKKVAGEWSDSEVTERGIKITGDVVAEWVSKTHEIFGGPKKTIVFCASVAHGDDLSRKFAEAGYNFVAISYKDDDKYKADVFEEFAKPDTSIHGLIATDILTKGFDCPDVMIGISARPFSKSLSSHIQQLGRVMRSFEGKEFGVWLDHSGNYLRFREDWEQVFSDGVSALDDGKEKPKPEPSDREKKEAKCPKCGHLWGVGDVCSHCGFVREARNHVVSNPGALEELRVKAQNTKRAKQKFYSEVIGYSELKGFKPGWAYHKFIEKFGEPPSRLLKMSAQPSLETMNWIKSRMIAYRKRNAA